MEKDNEILFCLEAETAVLNYILTTNNATAAFSALARLREEFFADPKNKELFALVRASYYTHGADPIHFLEKHAEYREMAQRIMQTASVMNWTRFENAAARMEESRQRRIIDDLGRRFLDMARSKDLNNPYGAAFNALLETDVHPTGHANPNGMDALADSFIKESRSVPESKIVSGWNRFDRYVGQTLTAIVGGKGIGKSTFALNLAYRLSANGHAGILYSNDMGKREAFERTLAIHGKLNYNLIQAREAVDQHLQQKVGAAAHGLRELPLEIHDDKVTLGDLINSLYHIKGKKDVRFVVIDGLDLLADTLPLKAILDTLRQISEQLGVAIYVTLTGDGDSRDLRAASTLMEMKTMADAVRSLKIVKNDEGPSGGTWYLAHAERTGGIEEAVSS